jgi:hypothetical protein
VIAIYAWPVVFVSACVSAYVSLSNCALIGWKLISVTKLWLYVLIYELLLWYVPITELLTTVLVGHLFYLPIIVCIYIYWLSFVYYSQAGGAPLVVESANLNNNNNMPLYSTPVTHLSMMLYSIAPLCYVVAYVCNITWFMIMNE